MKRSEIDKLFKSGKKSYGKILKVVSSTGSGEIIISAPIKTFKRAVDRNRVKRLLRVAIQEVDFSKVNAFVIYNTSEIKSIEEIIDDLKQIKI